jgi:hypothetical protein
MQEIWSGGGDMYISILMSLKQIWDIIFQKTLQV